MSEYESTDRNSANPSAPQPMDYPPPPSSPIPDGSQADSHHPVAQLPDLGRSERGRHSERPRRRRSQQHEGLDSSVKLYLGTGAVVVVVIAALLLWKVDKGTDVSGTQEPAPWDIEAPRPDAPMAPTWQSPVGETQSWPTQDNLAEYGQPNGYQTAGSPNGTPQAVQPDRWAGQPPTQAWGTQPDASALSGQPQTHQAWGTQPETAAWGTQQNTAVNPGQAEWEAGGTQAQAYPAAVQSVPVPQQSASVGQFQPDASPWNVDVQAVPVPMTGVPSQQAEFSPRIGRYMGTPPNTSAFTDRQTGAYRSEYQASQPTSGYQNSYQIPPSAQNRPMAMGGITPDSSYQSRACCPPTGATAYPAAPMARQDDPAVIARRDNYRPGGVGTYRQQAAPLQTPADAMGRGSAADYRTTYPNAIPSTSAGSYPRTYPDTYPAMNRQSGSAAPAATYPAPNTGASTLYPQSGTARLNGVIEQPTVRTTYDSTRSSLY